MSQLSINLEIIGAEKVNNVLKSVEQKLKDLRKLNANSGRDSKKLYDGEINSAKKLYDFKAREEIKLANWKEREIYKQNQRELNAARKLNNEKRKSETGGGTPSRGGRLAKGVASGLASGGMAMAGAAGLGAGVSAVINNAIDAADRRNEVSRSLLPFMTQLEGFTGGKEGHKQQEEYTKSVMLTSAKTGISSDELVRSLLTAQGMGGNGALYAKNLDKFATIAQAYGISIEDVMKTAATSFVNLPEKMKKNQEEGMKAVFDQMSTVIGGGKAGTLSPELISQIFGKLSANAKGIGGDYNKNVKTQLGLAQMIAPSVGSPEEIASTLRALNADLVGKSKELKGKYGIETIKNGRTRDPLEVMKEFLEKTKGNVKAQMLFGEASRKAVMALSALYQDGGIDRINREFDKVTVTTDNMNQALQFAKENVDQKAKDKAKLDAELAKAGDEFNSALHLMAPVATVAAKGLNLYMQNVKKFGELLGNIATNITGNGVDDSTSKRNFKNTIEEANEKSRAAAKKQQELTQLQQDFRDSFQHREIGKPQSEVDKENAEVAKKKQEAYEKQLEAAAKQVDAAELFASKIDLFASRTAPIGTGK